MPFGKTRGEQIATVQVHTGASVLNVAVELYGKDTSPSAVWATISTYMSNGTTTRCTTDDGALAIVNWPHVQAVTYVEREGC